MNILSKSKICYLGYLLFICLKQIFVQNLNRLNMKTSFYDRLVLWNIDVIIYQYFYAMYLTTNKIIHNDPCGIICSSWLRSFQSPRDINFHWRLRHDTADLNWRNKCLNLSIVKQTVHNVVGLMSLPKQANFGHVVKPISNFLIWRVYSFEHSMTKVWSILLLKLTRDRYGNGQSLILIGHKQTTSWLFGKSD